MADAIDLQSTPAESERASESRVSGTTVLLLVFIAALLTLAGFMLPGDITLQRIGTAGSWLHFAKQVLRQTLISAGVLTLALAVASRFPQVGLLLERAVLSPSRRIFVATMVGLAVLSSACFSSFALQRMPHIQDEIAMEFQAKVLASGRLYADTPPLPEFFDFEFILFDGPRWYGKYFLGPALLMAPGVWIGATWLISPLLAGFAVWLAYLIAREVFDEKIARVTALLLVLSPFRVSLFSMMMAHPGCLVFMALFTLGVVKVVKDPARVGWAVVAGFAWGLAFNSRPLTAVAMGGVIGVLSLINMPWRRFRWTLIPAFGVPVMLMALVYFGYNYALTGDPMLAPFTKWDPKDKLGFGPDVGLSYIPDHDRGHSFEKAITRNMQFTLDVLGRNLTGWGFATLPLLIIPLLSGWTLNRALGLAAVIGSLVFAYFFYYTPSVFAGQARYWSETMPMMVMLLALGLAVVRRVVVRPCRLLALPYPGRTARSAMWLTGGVLTIASTSLAWSPLIDECAHNYWGQGPMLRDLVEAEGLDNAVVFVVADYYREHAREMKWDIYGTALALNTPTLDGPVVYARDMGERNLELMALYPGRKAYWIDLKFNREARLIPLEEHLAELRAASRPE
jgi:uncharacterized membrane protein YidH (DUF202 family)